MFLHGAETHDALDARAVVPAPVEEDHLPCSWKMLCVPLEVPLAALALGGLRQGDDACYPGIEVFSDALDRAALA